MLLGYARVSKKDQQDTRLQLRALQDAGVARLFEEKASGGRWDRPELHRRLEQLRSGDVVVWKLDRLSRSLRDLIFIMDKIAAAGAGFRSLTEAIDTTSPAGRMVMQILGSFAEFERSMTRERTRAGLEAARAQGRLGGRRPKLRPDQAAEAWKMVCSGQKSRAEVARLFNVHPSTILWMLAHAPPPGKTKRSSKKTKRGARLGGRLAKNHTDVVTGPGCSGVVWVGLNTMSTGNFSLPMFPGEIVVSSWRGSYVFRSLHEDDWKPNVWAQVRNAILTGSPRSVFGGIYITNFRVIFAPSAHWTHNLSGHFSIFLFAMDSPAIVQSGLTFKINFLSNPKSPYSINEFFSCLDPVPICIDINEQLTALQGKIGKDRKSYDDDFLKFWFYAGFGMLTPAGWAFFFDRLGGVRRDDYRYTTKQKSVFAKLSQDLKKAKVVGGTELLWLFEDD
jgi:DNA invertase Pin-like site-specific DNA recombinase